MSKDDQNKCASKPAFSGEKVRLGEVCTKGKSSLRQKDLKNDGPFAVYGASGIVGTTSEYQNPTPYIAVVKDGAGVGRANICQGESSVLGTMQALIPNERVSCTYLLHLVRPMKLGEGFSGSTIPHIYFKDYCKRMVTVPSLDDQAKIVRKLDTVEAFIDREKLALTNLQILVKSRFIEMFGDLRANPMDWPVVGFDTFAVIDTKMTKDFERFADYPHIGIDSIESGSGALTGYRTVKEDAVKSGKYPFTPKHIIYSKIRPALNKVALPNFEGVCSADAYPILPDTKICNRVFLAHVMRSPFFLEYVLPLSGRAQMPKVNKDALKGFECPMPPLELQQEFASFVAQAAKLEFVAQRQIEKLQMLYDSLAQEYFG